MRREEFSSTRLFKMGLQGCLVLATFITFNVYSVTIPSHDFDPAIWVAHDSDVIKLAADTGTVLFEIPDSGEAETLAIDPILGRVWAATENKLQVYSFKGQVLFTAQTELGGEKSFEDATIVIDPTNSHAWVGTKRALNHFSDNGQLVSRLPINDKLKDITLDNKRGRLWLAERKRLYAIDVTTLATVVETSLPKEVEFDSVRYDESLDEIWVIQNKIVERYNVDGQKVFSLPGIKAKLLIPNGNGRAWIASEHSLYSLDASGIVLVQLHNFVENEIKALDADTKDYSLWIANEKTISHIDKDGVEILRINGIDDIEDIAFYRDILAPALSITAPIEGSYLNNKPEFLLSYDDIGLGVNPASIKFKVNDVEVPVDCTYSDESATCLIKTTLSEGYNSITARVSDHAGNISDQAAVNINIDTIIPVIYITNPVDSTFTNISNLLITGYLSESSVLLVNGEAATLAIGNTFSFDAILQEGLNTFVLQATDSALNTGASSVSINLDTSVPGAAIIGLLTVTDIGNGQVQLIGLAGSVEAGATIRITNTRTGQTTTAIANADGSFNHAMAGLPGDFFSIVVVDHAGNSSSAIDKQLPANYDETIGFITGTIIDGTLRSPISGVSVHARNSQAYTFTDSQGKFMLPIEGNKTWTLFFEKDGYVEARRDLHVRRSGDATVGKVGMQPWDTIVTRITAANGGSFTDSTGNVQVDFPPRSLNQDMDIRASYLHDRTSFPTKLPENMIFMGGVQMGPEHVAFNTPVTVRLKNTLQFPAGAEVPFFFASHDLEDSNEGFYDPGNGVVTADGQFVEFQVNHFSCMALGISPPSIPGAGTSKGTKNKQNDDKCNAAGAGGSSEVSYCKGDLSLTHEVPEFFALGVNDSPTFTYQSNTANPAPLISADIDMPGFYGNTNIPTAFRAILYIEGKETEMYLTPSNEVLPFNYIWDAKNGRNQLLSTGSYPYQLSLAEVRNIYKSVNLLDPYVDAVTLNGRVIVNNRTNSPFGAGWGMTELERLYQQEDGTALVTRGDGSSTVYHAKQILSGAEINYATLATGLNSPTSLTPLPDNSGYYVSSTTGIYLVKNGGEKTLITSEISPKGIAVSPDGTIYVGSQRNRSLFSIQPNGNPEIFATLPALDHLDDLAFGPDGNIYVLDGGFGIVYKVTPSGEVSFFYKGALAGPSLLSNSMSMAFDSLGNLYVSNNYNSFGQSRCGVSYISRFDALGNHSYFHVGLNAPRGIAIDENDNVYVMDYDCEGNSYDIKVISQSGQEELVASKIPGEVDPEIETVA